MDMCTHAVIHPDNPRAHKTIYHVKTITAKMLSAL